MGKDLIRRRSAETVQAIDPRGTYLGKMTDRHTGRQSEVYVDAHGKQTFYDLPVADQGYSPVSPQASSGAAEYTAAVMSRDGRLTMRLEGTDSPQTRQAALHLAMLASGAQAGGSYAGFAPSANPVYETHAAPVRVQHSQRVLAQSPAYDDTERHIGSDQNSQPDSTQNNRARRYMARGLMAATAIAAFYVPYMATSSDNRAPFAITDIAHPKRSPIVQDILTITEIPGKVISTVNPF